ncbi:unnamed protein product [Oppiella nova]|uniref:Uncharacterized protein n=1 Tax=Oppiella nova TaxID=334625 RepID=A0A7R9M6Q7_9ACAR|nr:unnamed protein product [Oppiella nova]CAG2170491.1 unnamed protein product [Oppiella nova]
MNGEDFALAVNTDNNVIFSVGRNNKGQLGQNVKRDWDLRKESYNCVNLRWTETHDKMNNSISFEKSFDVINKLGEGGYAQD